MALTLTWEDSTIFTSDNTNKLKLVSTLSTSPSFYFKVEVFKTGVGKVGTDKIFPNLNGDTFFDLSIYTRYLTPLYVLSEFSVKVTEMVSNVAQANSTIVKSGICKGWLNTVDNYQYVLKTHTFLSKFRYALIDKSLNNICHYAFRVKADFKVRTIKYGANGSIISDSTTAVSSVTGTHLAQSTTMTGNAVKVIVQLLSAADLVVDEYVFENITECSNVVITWVNQVGGFEQLALTHNAVENSKINSFGYQAKSGFSTFLKTWSSGGTIYTQDLNDLEQSQILDFFHSPDQKVVYLNEHGVVLTYRIIATNLNWELNQQYYEDTKPAVIDFYIPDLQKSILL